MEVGEAPSRKYPREKLEAIKNFLPVHERLKEKLQDQQMMKADLLEGRQEMFAPITTGIKTTLYGSDDAFRPKGEKNVAELLKEISENVKPVNPVMVKKEEEKEEEIILDPPPEFSDNPPLMIKHRARFTDEFLKEVENIDELHLAEFAADKYLNRKKNLKPGQENYGRNFEVWADAIYKLKYNDFKIDKKNMNILYFLLKLKNTQIL